MKMKYNIGVIGGATPELKYLEIAEKIGKLIAESGNVLVNGGLSGVMEYASKGADLAGGTVIGILPEMNHLSCNQHITISIPTGMGYARNFLIVRACHSLIAIDGSNGTISEASFAISEGKSVVSIDSLTLEKSREGEGSFLRATSPEDAVDKAIIEARKFQEKNSEEMQ
ncbi:MAG: TIGR00725 family protein [Thermoplasmataceae archaeon]